MSQSSGSSHTLPKIIYRIVMQTNVNKVVKKHYIFMILDADTMNPDYSHQRLISGLNTVQSVR